MCRYCPMIKLPYMTEFSIPVWDTVLSVFVALGGKEIIFN